MSLLRIEYENGAGTAKRANPILEMVFLGRTEAGGRQRRHFGSAAFLSGGLRRGWSGAVTG